MYEYDLQNCNIKDCNHKIDRLLLCNRHFKKYIIDNKSERIQDLIYRKIIGYTSLGEKLKFSLLWLLHHSIHRRIYYAEHFPLESLFLYHFRIVNKELNHFFSQSRKNGSAVQEEDGKYKSNVTKKLKTLIKDFGYDGNVHIPTIKNLISLIEDKLPEKKAEEYFVSELIQSNIPYSHKSFLVRLSLVSIICIVLLIVSNLTGFKIKPFFNLNILYILTASLVGFGWAYFGLRYFQSIDPVTKVSLKNKLYSKEENNTHFLQIVYRIKANLIRRYESLVGMKGAGLAIFIIMVIDNMHNANLTTTEIFVSVIMNGLLYFLFFTLFMLYPVFSNTSSLIWFMPKSDFYLDIYRLDKSMGINELLEMLNSYFIFNITFLIIIWFVLPNLFFSSQEKGTSLIIYWIITFFLGLLRVRSVRLTLRTYKNLRDKTNKTITEEKERIGTLTFSERVAKYKFLNELRFQSFNTRKIKKILFYFLTTIIVPVVIVIIDKNFDLLKNVLKLIINLLTTSSN